MFSVLFLASALPPALDQPLVANQLLLGLLHSDLFELGVRLSSRPVMRNVRGDGTLEHCWLNGITIQALQEVALPANNSRQNWR